MAKRHLPVRPDLDQLRHQAKDLLREMRRGDPAALADLADNHPEQVDPSSAKLADAQLALARSYGVPSWPRLVLACEVIDAIWIDDVDALRVLMLKHPRAVHEMARGTQRCNLEAHLRRDPRLLERTFSHEEIYPPEMGCRNESDAVHGTPLAGATLLHMSVDYDEMEIALWLLDRGMNVDAKAAVDADGFGGHTALFSTVVSQANFWPNHFGTPHDPAFTRLFLDRGADPNVRASLRKQLNSSYDDRAMHEYRDVTPLSWGERFQFRKMVSVPAMRLIAERMGLRT